VPRFDSPEQPLAKNILSNANIRGLEVCRIPSEVTTTPWYTANLNPGFPGVVFALVERFPGRSLYIVGDVQASPTRHHFQLPCACTILAKFQVEQALV
jgi:hypothetical protein